jgi:hypothetical protein
MTGRLRLDGSGRSRWPPTCRITLASLDQQRSELARLHGGKAVVAQVHVGRLVHAAVIDPPIGVLDRGGLNAYI